MWDAIKKGLQDGAAVAMNKAEELTQLGRAKLDTAVIKTRLNRLNEELGSVVYGLIESGKGEHVADEAEVRSICDRIRENEKDLTSSEAAFEELKADLEAGPEPGETNGEEQ